MTKKSPHELWMQKALSLALRGRFKVSPNPLVGACVVKNGKLISEGYHASFGSDHAEVLALRRAGKKALGATLYLTLEPCSSWGKTPPCVDAILEAGIRSVVIAASDPNPKHQGKGTTLLHRHGIKVITGILKAEAESQNQFFKKHIQTGFPYVTLKMAQTLDGKIATKTGKSRWISSPEARNFVHALRAEQDAVLVGAGTFFQDDPVLIPSGYEAECSPGKPWRIFLDSKMKAPASARIFKNKGTVVQIVAESVFKKKFRTPFGLNAKGRVILPVAELRGRLHIKDLLTKLGGLGVAKLLVEGGGELAWSMINEGSVDRLIWIVAPKIFGGRNSKTSVEGDGVKVPEDAFLWRWKNVELLGEDILIEAEKK